MKLAILAVCVVAVAAKPRADHFNGPAPLSWEGRFVGTPKLAESRARLPVALAQAGAESSALARTSSSSSFEGYSYEAPVRKSQALPAPIYGAPTEQPLQAYGGPFAPLGEDGRVVDTEEVAKLKAEHLAALEKAHAEANAIRAEETAPNSSSSEGYYYEAPLERIEKPAPKITYGPSVTEPQQQAYIGPFAPLGDDGRVVDTDEVAKLKAQHLATLEMANAEAAAIEAMEAALNASTFRGYIYEAPVRKSPSVPTRLYGAPSIEKQPQQLYDGPLAPIGQDGRVVDTEQVAKVKADHLAKLDKAVAAAAAIKAAAMEAASNANSFKGYTYEAPVRKAPTIPGTLYGVPVVESQPQQLYSGPFAPIGQDGRVVDTEEFAKLKAKYLATLDKVRAEAAVIAAMEAALGYSSEASTPTTTPRAPVTELQQPYRGPLAPLGQDGQVIDTDEVAKLKADHIAILEQANAEVAAFEATSASPSSSNEGYFYEAPTIGLPAGIQGTPVENIERTYLGPTASLSQNGQIVGTRKVAQSNAKIVGTLTQANAKAEASAASASSSASSVDVTYGIPAAQRSPILMAPAPIIKGYSGPLAPLAEDGRVLDTDEVARIKADRLATLAKATAEAIDNASAEAARDKLYLPPLPLQAPFGATFRDH